MKTKVFWQNPHYQPHPQLTKDIQCEYLIVGGGVTGVSLAYFLASRGVKDIVLVERDSIASGATGRAAGIFAHGMERGEYWQFVNKFGISKVKTYWDAQISLMKKVQNLITKERIDCDFHLGRCYVVGRRAEEKTILKEFDVRKKLHDEVVLLKKQDIVNEIGTGFFDIGEKIRKIPLVNPLKFTQNLSRVLFKYGVRVYEKTSLLSVRNNTAYTPGGRIKFRSIIYAMDSFSQNAALMKIKTSIVVTKPLSRKELRKAGLSSPFAFEDCEPSSYNYGRLLPDDRILVGGGDALLRSESDRFSTHRTHIRYLQSYLRRVFPSLNNKVEYVWSGTVGSPKTLMPFVSIQKNRYAIAGTGTQICSMVLAEYVAYRILRKTHPLDKVFK